MKKMIGVMLVLAMLVPGIAAGADLANCAVANAVVAAVTWTDVTAPFSGRTEVFDLAVGDSVSAGQVLMNMQTTRIYAGQDGAIASMFAKVGDDAAALCARYGGIMTIEPEHLLLVKASTKGADNDDENKLIHTGETVWFHQVQNKKHEGSGQVIAVNNDGYSVEILEYDDLGIGKNVLIFRDSKYTGSKKIGMGKIVRAADMNVQAAGRIVALYVTAGQQVKTGDLLAEVVAEDAPAGTDPVVRADCSGIVSAVRVAGGQSVARGQVLLRIDRTDKLEVIASVDEMDLNGIQVGSSVSVTLDTDETQILTGMVTEISGMGVSKTNASYFDVHVSLPEGIDARLGGNASVYIPR